MKNLKFEAIDLSEELQRGIKDMGFEEMSPIQSQAIPEILAGRDVIGQAQTGTGKTAAFAIPIIEKSKPKEKHVQALVLCPTRELSIQVAKEISRLAKFKKGISVLPIYGGQSIERQIRALKRGVNIIVGTPGRLLDHIRRKTLKIGNVKMMVLDEADEMFDMGFRDDIALVMDELKKERQTIFFSATMANEIMKFASKYQVNPEIIKVVHKKMTVAEVDQTYLKLKSHMKTEILSRLIDIHSPKLAIVFCNTKRKVDELTEQMQIRGYFADGLHGDLKQSQRDNVMGRFRKEAIDILIATDVAARGIDVDDVDLVVNYDIPQDEEYYVHRVGRTARAGRKGKAISFVAGREIYKLRDIQRYTKTKISREELPTLKDIESNYSSKILEKIRAEIDNKNLSKYEEILKRLIHEDYSVMEIAAALLKFHMAKDKLARHEKLEAVDFHGKPKKSPTYVRLHINVGSNKGVKSRHILAGIMENTSISKNHLGKIDIYDRYSFVDISKKHVENLIRDLKDLRIKGIKVKIERARPRGKKFN